MSMFKPSDGLFGTYFRESDLKRGIANYLGNDSELIDYSIEPLTVFQGSSMLGHVFVKSAQKNEDFFLKVPSCLLVKQHNKNDAQKEEFEERLRKFHNREMDFFKLIASKLPDLKVPRLIAGRRFDKQHRLDAYALLDFIDGACMLKEYEFAGAQGTKKLLDQLAMVHATALLDCNINPDTYDTTASVDLYEKFLRDERIGFGLDGLETFINHSRPELFRILRNKLNTVANAAYFFRINEKLGCPPVLVHGDMWSGNVMWNKTGNGDYSISGIVDWQCCRLGNPGEDLSRMFTWSLSPEDRKKHGRDLLLYYYERLNGILNANGYNKPFTYDQLLRGYKLTLPACSMISVPYYPQMFEKDSKDFTSEEEIASKKEIVVQNIIAVLEEIAEIIECMHLIEDLETPLCN